MSVPTAIASGRGAESKSAVRPLRAGIVAGVLAALALLAVFVTAPLPARVLAWFGAPSEGVARYGGLRMEWAPPPGEDLAVIERAFVQRGDGASVHRAGDVLVIELPGVAPDLVEEVAREIGSGLAFHAVVQAPEMAQLIRLLELPMEGARPVDAEIDQWRPDSGGVQVDYYLVAERREELDAAFARAAELGWRLPAGTAIAYEQIEADPASSRRGTYWRSYVIEAHASLDGRRIASAQPSYDPHTNRPIVLLDFDEEGAERFAALTSRIVGQKLATLIGDRVVSAPIINGAILGGRASITMAGSDPRAQEYERDMLVWTLRAVAVPPGGTVRHARYIEPSALVRSTLWPGRLVIALGGGALIGLAAWALVRATRPVRGREPARFAGRVPWARLGVTLLAPLSLVVLRLVQVPGLGRDVSSILVVAGQEMHFASFGVSSVISAYILVELVALLVPAWRRRRFSEPGARLPLYYATIVLGLGLVICQGWYAVQLLESLAYDVGLGGGARWLIIGNLAVGTLALANVAELIRRFGIGNGYAALLVSEWVIFLVSERDAITAQDLLAGGSALLAGGVVTAALLRWRMVRAGEVPLRLPTSGGAPLTHVFALVGLLALTTGFVDWFAGVSAWLPSHPAIGLGAALVTTAVWSLAFARPSLVQRFAARLGQAPPSWSTWRAATALSAGGLILIGAPFVLLEIARPDGLQLATAAGGALGTAWLLDVVHDLRRRRGALVRVWSLHQAQHLELAQDALGAADIAVHASGAHLRVLLAWFGPWAPIDLYVRPEDAAAATEKLEALFAPA